jgi:hypothetical protein
MTMLSWKTNYFHCYDPDARPVGIQPEVYGTDHPNFREWTE